MLDNLNHDVILHLLKFCNYNNALALKNTNSEFNTIIKKFTVIQKKLEEKIKSRLNLYTFLSYKDSHLHKCLNEQCCNKNEFIECYSQMINLNRCMGLTRLYFPQKIVPKQNSNLQSVKPIESSEYKNTKYTTRFIHYCEDCMLDNILPNLNYYDGKKYVEIPYGDDVDIFNL